MNVSGVSFAAADESCLRSGETLRSEDDESEEDEEDIRQGLASDPELAATKGDLAIKLIEKKKNVYKS